MIPDTKVFHTKDLSAQIHSARLSFAKPEYMEKFLDITPGSVSVLGLMNDTGHRVQLLIDEDVLNSEFVGCHPCINTSSLRLRTKDLIEKSFPLWSTTYQGEAVNLRTSVRRNIDKCPLFDCIL